VCVCMCMCVCVERVCRWIYPVHLVREAEVHLWGQRSCMFIIYMDVDMRVCMSLHVQCVCVYVVRVSNSYVP